MLKKRPQQEIDWAIPPKGEEADSSQRNKARNWFWAIVDFIGQFF
jgi:hypothetical protein